MSPQETHKQHKYMIFSYKNFISYTNNLPQTWYQVQLPDQSNTLQYYYISFSFNQRSFLQLRHFRQSRDLKVKPLRIAAADFLADWMPFLSPKQWH